MPEDTGLDMETYHDRFRSGAVSVILTPSEESRPVRREIVRHFVDEHGALALYTTISRPYRSIEQEFKSEGINTGRLFYLDAASRVGGASMTKSDNVVYLDPRNLTQLSIGIANACSSVQDDDLLVVVDALSTLAVYNDKKTVARFAHALMSKLRREDRAISVMLSICEETDDELESHFTQFADEVIHLSDHA